MVKVVVAACLYYSGLLALALTVLGRARRRYPAVILFYHRFKENKDRTIPAKLWIRRFDRQMRHLKRWYSVISLDELVEHVRSRRAFRRPTVVVTIDDGFRDNYELAFPVLCRLGLPATIFLTAGFIGTEGVPWVDEIGIAMAETRARSLVFPELFTEEIDLASPDARADAFHEIYERLLPLGPTEREELVSLLLERLGFEKGGRREGGRVMLSWEEVKAMEGRGITYGAHTVSHPTLSRMAFECAAREILASKRMIDGRIQARTKHFAIPNGRDEDFTEELRELCRNEGFESIVTTNYGTVDAGTDPYRLPRVCLPDRLCVFAFDLARLLVFP